MQTLNLEKREGMNLKSVAYIRDVLQIRKLSFWVCLKTRRVTKRDALVLATLRYILTFKNQQNVKIHLKKSAIGGNNNGFI